MPPAMKRKVSSGNQNEPVSGTEQAVRDLDHKLFDILKEIGEFKAEVFKKLEGISKLENQLKEIEEKIDASAKFEEIKENQETVLMLQRELKDDAAARKHQMAEVQKKIDLIEEQCSLSKSSADKPSDTVFITNKMNSLQEDTGKILEKVSDISQTQTEDV